jgi:hypothetical protein
MTTSTGQLTQVVKSPWFKRFTHVAIWAVTELAVGAVGLDTLANYAEFLADQQQTVACVTETLANLITMV